MKRLISSFTKSSTLHWENRKDALGVSRLARTHPISRLKSIKIQSPLKDICFEMRTPGHSTHSEPPREKYSPEFNQSGNHRPLLWFKAPGSCSHWQQTLASSIQYWYWSMQNARVVGSRRFSFRFQRKAGEVRQYMTSSEALPGPPERTTCEALGVRQKLQWRPQEDEDQRNTEHLPRKVAGNVQGQSKRELNVG